VETWRNMLFVINWNSGSRILDGWVVAAAASSSSYILLVWFVLLTKLTFSVQKTEKQSQHFLFQEVVKLKSVFVCVCTCYWLQTSSSGKSCNYFSTSISQAKQKRDDAYYIHGTWRTSSLWIFLVLVFDFEVNFY